MIRANVRASLRLMDLVGSRDASDTEESKSIQSKSGHGYHATPGHDAQLYAYNTTLSS